MAGIDQVALVLHAEEERIEGRQEADEGPFELGPPQRGQILAKNPADSTHPRRPGPAPARGAPRSRESRTRSCRSRARSRAPSPGRAPGDTAGGARVPPSPPAGRSSPGATSPDERTSPGHRGPDRNRRAPEGTRGR